MTQEEQRLNDYFNVGVFRPSLSFEEALTNYIVKRLVDTQSINNEWKNFTNTFCKGKIIPKNLEDKI